MLRLASFLLLSLKNKQLGVQVFVADKDVRKQCILIRKICIWHHENNICNQYEHIGQKHHLVWPCWAWQSHLCSCHSQLPLLLLKTCFTHTSHPYIQHWCTQDCLDQRNIFRYLYNTIQYQLSIYIRKKALNKTNHVLSSFTTNHTAQ